MGDLRHRWGLAITWARTGAGLSKRALARAVDVDPSFLTHLENETKLPSVGTLEKIADACGVRLFLLVHVAECGPERDGCLVWYARHHYRGGSLPGMPLPPSIVSILGRNLDVVARKSALEKEARRLKVKLVFEQDPVAAFSTAMRRSFDRADDAYAEHLAASLATREDVELMVALLLERGSTNMAAALLRVTAPVVPQRAKVWRPSR